MGGPVDALSPAAENPETVDEMLGCRLDVLGLRKIEPDLVGRETGGGMPARVDVLVVDEAVDVVAGPDCLSEVGLSAMLEAAAAPRLCESRILP